MSRLGFDALRSVLWLMARRPVLAAEAAISTGRRGLRLAGSRVQRRIEARLREMLLVLMLAMAGLVLGLAGGVFLLMALWGDLAAYLGPNGASLSLGLGLVGASILPLAIAAWRTRLRRHTRD
jgi:hypothetical protein